MFEFGDLVVDDYGAEGLVLRVTGDLLRVLWLTGDLAVSDSVVDTSTTIINLLP